MSGIQIQPLPKAAQSLAGQVRSQLWKEEPAEICLEKLGGAWKRCFKEKKERGNFKIVLDLSNLKSFFVNQRVKGRNRGARL